MSKNIICSYCGHYRNKVIEINLCHDTDYFIADDSDVDEDEFLLDVKEMFDECLLKLDLWEHLNGSGICNIEDDGGVFTGLCGPLTVETKDVVNFNHWNNGFQDLTEEQEDKACEDIIVFDSNPESSKHYTVKELWDFEKETHQDRIYHYS